ncbi:MFS transporter [Altererythrobacter confluentis]|uniref:MFS transporter n=1 Tax=Allopontixanthobacter confluentis TaxID=1849021 RepID=A0A6L7GDW2_9SPHN|nr:MFS transporter [Allopontixanthobacter confluentis]MXP13646.1 MFS transporter [Allopontixanthobacter confluentis]
MIDRGPLVDTVDGYRFKPHEMPILPGSPANPDHPPARRAAYLAIGVFMGLIGGAQNGFLIANSQSLQAEFTLTPVETGWLTVAFYSTYATMSMLLFRVRQEFGIQPFVRWAMAGLVLANFVQLVGTGYHAELAARAVAGITASGLSALAIYYLMQGLPPALRVGGLVISLGLTQIAVPLTRALSPALMVDGDITHVFQFQFALSLLGFGMVYLLRLPPGIRKKTFETLDLPSITLFIIGVAALCAFLIQGRIQWWDTPWLGYTLVVAIFGLGGCFLIEFNRKTPMLDLSWLSSRSILALALVGASVRILVAEQGFGASGMFVALGYGNEQLTGYFWILAGAALAGMVLSVIRLDPTDLTRPVLFAILVIGAAAFADTRTGVMTRPQDLYLTQAAIAFGAVFAMGPIMMEGMLRALAAGQNYVISFIAVFSLSQSVGGLAGISLLSAFHTVRLKTHLIDAGNTLTLANQQLAQALGNAARSVAPVQSDPALQQQVAASTISQDVGREAAVLAFNDVFFLIGTLSAVTFAVVFVPWLINKFRGTNPLAKELAFMEAMLARTRQ